MKPFDWLIVRPPAETELAKAPIEETAELTVAPLVVENVKR